MDKTRHTMGALMATCLRVGILRCRWLHARARCWRALLGHPEPRIFDVIHGQDQYGRCVPVTACRLLEVLRSGTTIQLERDIFTRRNGTTISVQAQ
jgi:hypothetical protein